MNNIIQFYTKISKTYDLMNHVVYSERLSRKIIELAEIKEHNTVLDLACGTGWLSRRLEGRNVLIHGVDLTPFMLAKAKRRINGDFVLGVAEALPYRSESFDAILCNMAFSHFDYQAAAGEIYRTLKPKGRFVVTDSVDPNPGIYDALAYYPARSIVKLLWVLAGQPIDKTVRDNSKAFDLKSEKIRFALGEYMETKVELHYDLLGPASRLKSGCEIIHGIKR
ncbi:MAG: methyltransferase domain-containing protein [Methanothrix sp.]|nr:MAG: methyltransferase domain-containing protein [Methanothrix sp.]